MQTNVIYHIKKLKNKSCINSIDIEKSFWQNSTPIHDKKKKNSGHRRNLPQHNKAHVQQTHRKHNSQWWKNKSIASKIGRKTKMFTLSTFIQHSFGSCSHINHRIKRKKRNPNWKRSRTVTACDQMYGKS